MFATLRPIPIFQLKRVLVDIDPIEHRWVDGDGADEAKGGFTRVVWVADIEGFRGVAGNGAGTNRGGVKVDLFVISLFNYYDSNIPYQIC